MTHFREVSIEIMWCSDRGEPLEFPHYQSELAAGADLRSAVSMAVEPGQRVALPTGLKVGVPAGYEIQIRARSGFSLKSGLTLINGVGTIDADFRGEIHVLFVNLSTQTVSIARGDRLAQMVLCEVPRIRWKPVQGLSETGRGEGGFGSSGTH